MNVPGTSFVPPRPPLKPPSQLQRAVSPWGLNGVPGQGAAGSSLAHAAGTPVTAATSPVLGRPLGQSTPLQAVESATSTAQLDPYDLSADPAVQAATALGNETDQQAKSSALSQEQQALLAYGDPNLINSVLGDSTLASAAAANPNSTLHQLAHTRDTNLTTLDNGLNASNLIYSGDRVVQEGQQAQDYQNALAQAAAAVQGDLSSIQGGLTSEEGQSNQQRIQAISDAATRAMQQAIATGTDPGYSGTTAGSAGGATFLGSAALAKGGTGIGGKAKAAATKAAYKPTAATSRIVAR